MTNSTRMRLGFGLAAVGLLISGLFFVGSFHNLYWKSPISFIPITLGGVGASIYGGFLAGNNLPLRKKAGALIIVLIVVGWLVAIVGTLLGGLTSLSAIVQIGGGYWGESRPYGHHYYNGDYMGLGIHVMALQACLPLCAVGYFLIGLGRRQRNNR